MAANRGSKALNVSDKTEQIIARFRADLLPNAPLGNHHPNGPHAFPLSSLMKASSGTPDRLSSSVCGSPGDHALSR